MDGVTRYKILTTAYSRDHLLDQGKKNGISWKEDKDEGINWFRFSIELLKHLDSDSDFHTDDADEVTLQTLLDSYKTIKELCKKMMVPHLRATMSKLASERGSDTNPMELIGEAYEHLDEYGGQAWAHKVRTLSEVNSQIEYLSGRLGSGTVSTQVNPEEANGGDTIKESIE